MGSICIVAGGDRADGLDPAVPGHAGNALPSAPPRFLPRHRPRRYAAYSRRPTPLGRPSKIPSTPEERTQSATGSGRRQPQRHGRPCLHRMKQRRLGLWCQTPKQLLCAVHRAWSEACGDADFEKNSSHLEQVFAPTPTASRWIGRVKDRLTGLSSTSMPRKGYVESVGGPSNGHTTLSTNPAHMKRLFTDQPLA